MANTNLPNLGISTDQLRVDNSVVGPAAKPPATPKCEEEKAPDAKADIFPFMRAYGCLGRKSEQQE